MNAAHQAIRPVRGQDWLSDLPWRPTLRWGLTGILALLALAGGAYLLERLGDVGRFPVRSVSVDGPVSFTDRERLEAVVTEFSNLGFYQADLSGLRRSLLDLPWVSRVAIRKVWPDQLRIHLLEHQPIAVWNGEHLLSQELTVFRPAADQVQALAAERGLPQMSGPDGQAEQVWSVWQSWSTRLADQGLLARTIHRDARGGWRIGLDQGPQLLLGRQDMDQRLDRWLGVQSGADAIPLERVERIDLRYTNGFAVAWKPAPPEQQG